MVTAQGLVPFGPDGETSTRGLESLQSDCQEYRRQGARFAKWRAALKVTDGLPSEAAVQRNAEELAEYAAIAQVRASHTSGHETHSKSSGEARRREDHWRD